MWYFEDNYLIPFFSSYQPLATLSVFFISVDLHILGVPYTWNYIFIQASFRYHSISKIHPHCPCISTSFHFFYFLFWFLRQGLCSPGWLWTQNPPASAFRVVRLQACTIKLSLHFFLWLNNIYVSQFFITVTKYLT
jgi:hypothetical protein